MAATAEEEAPAVYKHVFSIEATVNPLKYVLGGYITTLWPEWCTEDHAHETFLGMKALLKGTEHRPVPDMDAIHQFLRSTRLRTRMDGKCHGPFLLQTDFPMDRAAFAKYIESLSPTEVEEKFLNNKGAKI